MRLALVSSYYFSYMFQKHSKIALKRVQVSCIDSFLKAKCVSLKFELSFLYTKFYLSLLHHVLASTCSPIMILSLFFLPLLTNYHLHVILSHGLCMIIAFIR
ncbi:hypothetical protein O6H91_Y342300 [Diphasiastrum complanatum]|nr:hypothetical protein O6H91_Y342300 [Diphasiastrum complanatum]